MNIVIDQGNTQFKAAIFQHNKVLDTQRFSYNELQAFFLWMEKYRSDLKQGIVSSVVNNTIDLQDFALEKVILLDRQTPIPIINDYQSPETLGKDRLANMVGAWSINPNKNSLVVDFGTCIKYDLILADSHYKGGIISPGLNMRFKSMNAFTAKLPLIEPKLNFDNSIGTDTLSSMECGVYFGITHEIKGIIERYTQQYGHLTLFMTGGDFKYFEKQFKNHIFANQNLTLLGLNEILNHNA